MTAKKRQQDRRAATRPRAGDIQPCPFCRGGAMVFQEDYLGHSPAWVCQKPDCGYRQFVRPRRAAAELARAAKNVDTRVRRAAMRARTQVNEAERHIARTNEQLTRKKRKTGS